MEKMSKRPDQEVIARTNWPRVMRWTLPLALLALWVVVRLSAAILDWRWPLPSTQWMLLAGSLWVVFGITRALYTDALVEETERRQQLIDILERTQRELAQEERRAGVLMERHRLSRDLHDTLAQSLTGIVLHLEAALQRLPAGPKTAQDHITQARASARTSLQEVRRLLSALRPGLLEKTSLSEAVSTVVKAWKEAHEECGTAISLALGPLGWLHPEVEVTLLRAVQEALANVHKHAQARTVMASLKRDETRVYLTVSDDGVGLGTASVRTPEQMGGYGLLAMRERVAELGGELSVENKPEGGVKVSLWLPISGEVGLLREQACTTSVDKEGL